MRHGDRKGWPGKKSKSLIVVISKQVFQLIQKIEYPENLSL